MAVQYQSNFTFSALSYKLQRFSCVTQLREAGHSRLRPQTGQTAEHSALVSTSAFMGCCWDKPVLSACEQSTPKPSLLAVSSALARVLQLAFAGIPACR